MKPHYEDAWLTIYGGDNCEVMAGLPDDSVDCVVTSPPYWGLRDYGTATWTPPDIDDERVGREFVARHWDRSTQELRTELEAEADGCAHLAGPLTSSKSGLAGYTSENIKLRTNGVPFKGQCGKCGAVRQDSQLGLERTPEEYVANMGAVFHEVRRVLKPSGTCWLNLGDSYAGGRSGPQGGSGEMADRAVAQHRGFMGVTKQAVGLKSKDLVGIPWRVAFALQADGWYLRSDIIWSKPNPMPESVTDRPTKSHEYLFLLTKSARYYFDAEAVREPNVSPEQAAHNERYAKVYDAHTTRVLAGDGGQPGNVNNLGIHARGGATVGRNIRSVWNIATRPYPGAHFAVFPPELPERCIKAGAPEGGVVLDPFGGSGTVGMVANRLSRRAILIDLNPDYLRQQMARNAQAPLGLTEGDAA